MKRAALALVLLGSLLVAGCGSSGQSVDVTGKWTLSTVALPDGSTVPIRAMTFAWIGLGPERDGSGRDGANNFMLHYEQSGATLRFTDVSTTLVGVLDSAPKDLRASVAGMDAMLSGRDVTAARDGSALVVTVPGAAGDVRADLRAESRLSEEVSSRTRSGQQPERHRGPWRRRLLVPRQ